MASKFLLRFNSICTGYLFHPERIRCPRSSHPKRDVHTQTKFLNFVKKIKSSGTFKILAGVTLGVYLLDYISENEAIREERRLKYAGLKHSCNFIADVVDAVADAVVHITVNENSLLSSGSKAGSGFIIKNDGLIITNAHVVGNKYGKNVHVTLRNGKSFDGVVKDIDEVIDLAMLEIRGKDLPVLKFGSANKLRPGEWVIAIGSPMCLSDSVTAGVVSSVHRRAAEIGFPHRNINYIQTDTTVVTGHSGGPLVNLDGEVVGVNTMTLTPGISFAIPAEYVKKFVERYNYKSETGAVRYYIGVLYLPLNPETVNHILSIVKLPENLKRGVYVWKVEPNSPAYACGLQSGDVIFEAEGEQVYDMKCLFDKFETKNTVTIKFYRKGLYYKTNVTPIKRF